jgi:hypothetical protein
MTEYLMYVVVQNGSQVITASQDITFDTTDDMKEDAKAEAMRFVGISDDEDLVEVVLFQSNNGSSPTIAYKWNCEDGDDLDFSNNG